MNENELNRRTLAMGWRIVIRDVLSRQSVVDSMRLSPTGGGETITVSLTPTSTTLTPTSLEPAPTPMTDDEAIKMANAKVQKEAIDRVQDLFSGRMRRSLLLSSSSSSSSSSDADAEEAERKEKLRVALADVGFELPFSSPSSTSSDAALGREVHSLVHSIRCTRAFFFFSKPW